MILRRVHPDADVVVSFDEPTAPALLDSLYSLPRPEWLRVNLVVSIDGSAAGSDGSSASLTRGADRRVLGAIRRQAQVVLVGARTVRSEGYQLPRTAALAVVTTSGDLSGHAFDVDVAPGRLVVLCAEQGETRARDSLGVPEADVVVVPSEQGRIEPADIIAALRSRGFASIVCEGGPELASELIDAGLVDELCITTAPVFAPGQVRSLSLVGAPDASLRQLLVDDVGASYALWSIN